MSGIGNFHINRISDTSELALGKCGFNKEFKRSKFRELFVSKKDILVRILGRYDVVVRLIGGLHLANMCVGCRFVITRYEGNGRNNGIATSC